MHMQRMHGWLFRWYGDQIYCNSYIHRGDITIFFSSAAAVQTYLASAFPEQWSFISCRNCKWYHNLSFCYMQFVPSSAVLSPWMSFTALPCCLTWQLVCHVAVCFLKYPLIFSSFFWPLSLHVCLTPLEWRKDQEVRYKVFYCSWRPWQ